MKLNGVRKRNGVRKLDGVRKLNGVRKVPGVRKFIAVIGVCLVIAASCSSPSNEGRKPGGEGRPKDAGSQHRTGDPNKKNGGSHEDPTDDSDAVVDTLGVRFTDVSKDAGLTAEHSDPEFVYGQTMTSGAAVADVNGDGRDDIFLTRAGRPNVLYINNGDGTFSDGTEAAGLAEAEPTYGSSAAVFFDANGDGSLDLFVTGFGRGQNRFYVNDGAGRFTDRSVERGLVFPPLASSEDFAQMHGATVGDVNGDGFLDLLVLHWYTAGLDVDMDAVAKESAKRGYGVPALLGACQFREIIESLPAGSEPGDAGVAEAKRIGSRSGLFINDGNGNFTEKSSDMGLNFSDVIAFTGIFHDIDGDGRPDLAVTGDGCSSRLYRNVDGERFEDITESAGVGTDENGMGAVIADINGDGLPDWLIGSIAYGKRNEDCIVGGSVVGCSGNRLYINNGDGTFEDRTDRSGLWDGGWAWGIAVEDFANTGDVQVAMTNGYVDEQADKGDARDKGNPFFRFMRRFAKDPTRFWMKNSSGRFIDVAKQVGVTDTGVGHALIPFDFDDDGDLDILIAQAGQAPILYRNDITGDRSWLTIRLDDPSNPGNRWGDGARIKVFANAENGDKDAPSAKAKVGWITTGGSYESQKPAEFHLGFGERQEPVKRIDIYWPGATKPQQIRDVELNQKLVVERRT